MKIIDLTNEYYVEDEDFYSACEYRVCNKCIAKGSKEVKFILNVSSYANAHKHSDICYTKEKLPYLEIGSCKFYFELEKNSKS